MNSRPMQNIPKTLEKLCALFDAELERQITVQAMCKAQGNAARQSDMETLHESTESLVALMDDALHAEKMRLEILHWVVAHYRLPLEEHTLSDLIAVVPQPWRDRMKKFQHDIKGILIDTQKIITRNEGFMNQAAQRLEDSIHTVVDRATGEPDGYSPNGMESKGKHSPALLNAVG